jgi:hypothetical protein
MQAQDVSGFWKGTLTMTGGCFPVNHIELQITVTGDQVQGNSYHYLDIHNYVKKKLSGKYNASQKKLSLQEGMVTTFKIPSHCIVCIKDYELVYSREGNVETLTGSWKGQVINTNAECQPGTIVLSRIKESAFKEIPEIAVDTGDIRLDFYDNGEIDGDSISVLVNKKLVLSHQKLAAKPITTYVKIDPQNTLQEIEMVAENLGSIPPNTALLIITAGTKRYRLFLTSTEMKSAMVRFVYEAATGDESPPPDSF